jgi:hypothetical protein
MLAELLSILDQEIPEFGEPESSRASFARGRNAEKTASANYLRYHIQRLGITLPDNAPWPVVRKAEAIKPRAFPPGFDWDKWDAAHGR